MDNQIRDELILDVSDFLSGVRECIASTELFGKTFRRIKELNIRDIEEEIEEQERLTAKVKEAVEESEGKIKELKAQLKDVGADKSLLEKERSGYQKEWLREDANLTKMKDSPEADTSKGKRAIAGQQRLVDTLKAEWEQTQASLEEVMQLENGLKGQLDDEISARDTMLQQLKDLKKARAELKERQAEIPDETNWFQRMKARFADLKKQRKEALESKTNPLEKVVNSAKSFVLTILGATSAMKNFNKLANQNKELADSIQALWKVAGEAINAIGTAIGGIFSNVANIVKKLISYIASVVYYATGINIIDKALKNGAKSAKEIQKSLAGFDEINNLDNGGGGGGDTGWMDSLKDVKLDMDWVDKFNELTGIPDIFKDIIALIKDPSWEKFRTLCSDLVFILGAVGTAFVIINASNPFGWVLIGISLLAGLIGGFDKVKDRVKAVWESIKKWFGESYLGKELKKLENAPEGVKKVLNGIVGFIEGTVNVAIKGINWLIRQLNKIHWTAPDWVPIIGGKSIGFDLNELNGVSLGRLDTGTNYVPADQLAYIHKGEAVIPKKFNEKEYFGGGNEETNQLLTNILNIVSNMEIKPVVAVSDIVKGINKQSRLKGVSVV